MKTDEELIQRLRRASSSVRPPAEPLARLRRRGATKRRHERLAAGGVAFVLLVAVVGGALFALRGVSAHRRQVTGQGPSLQLGVGQFVYVKDTLIQPTFQLDGQIAMQGGTVTIESWWATDNSGKRTGSNDGAGYGLPEQGTWGPGQFPIGDDISGLSTDPGTLLDQLRERSGTNGASPEPDVTPAADDQTTETGGLWRAVTDLIDYPNATPEQRAALAQAAELIPGVHRVDGVTDPVGRSAYALELDIEGQAQRIDVNPTTLQPLAIELTLDGQTSSSYQIFEEGIVDSTEAPPTGDQWITPAPVSSMPTPGVWIGVSSTAEPSPIASAEPSSSP